MEVIVVAKVPVHIERSGANRTRRKRGKRAQRDYGGTCTTLVDGDWVLRSGGGGGVRYESMKEQTWKGENRWKHAQRPAPKNGRN